MEEFSVEVNVKETQVATLLFCKSPATGLFTQCNLVASNSRRHWQYGCRLVICQRRAAVYTANLSEMKNRK